ncbi:MAG: preprotein translocase subunit YajC [Eubacteriales bacterium]|nr:preprotein translocase subunit YajC [Eubacteriales bacterium]MDD3882967.1 preprotein translocase subunit YajC [Eubacteriales bacterium]MDD4513486.1 preprotein translocase subunit YajC [Eubacteriales bacterium]
MINFLSLMLDEAAPAVAGAATGTAGAAAGMGTTGALLSTLIPMGLLLVVFYFMLIRPQRKKDKKVKDMLAALKVNDRICTIGGIYGTITGIRDDTVILTVGKDNMNMVVARWAIRNVEEGQVENDSEQLV